MNIFSGQDELFDCIIGQRQSGNTLVEGYGVCACVAASSTAVGDTPRLSAADLAPPAFPTVAIERSYPLRTIERKYSIARRVLQPQHIDPQAVSVVQLPQVVASVSELRQRYDRRPLVDFEQLASAVVVIGGTPRTPIPNTVGGTPRKGYLATTM